MPVLQVAQIKDILWGLRRYGGEEVLVVLAEHGAVEVAEDHNLTAVKARRQVLEDGIEAGGLQGGVLPAEKKGKRRCRQQKQGQRPERTALFSG